jgi:xanthine dehydrogenase YagR molybdenum-binding subunit
MLPRFDEALAFGNLPSSCQKSKLGAKSDGKLHAFELDSYGTAGIGSGGSTAGGGGGTDFPAPYIYKIPNTRARQSGVAINAGSARAFRAPGNPTASFGMESIMDELAVKLSMDPVELRLKNDTLRFAKKSINSARNGLVGNKNIKNRAVATAPSRPASVARRHLGRRAAGTHADAQSVRTAASRFVAAPRTGTGPKTVIALIAADLLGQKPEHIVVRVGDTRYPSSGRSGGSSTTPSVAPAIHNVCTNALEELQKKTGVADARGEHWLEACKKLGVDPLHVSGEWQEGLSSGGAGGVQFAEVEVDTETGFVKVKKITCVQDGGMIMSKLTCESQVNGGIIMGIGYALYEERIMDRTSGVVLNPNLETYKIPALGDIPEIDIVLLDIPENGPIGIGEPVTIPTASAIANAVANAIGVRVGSLPITPARVLEALGQLKDPTPKPA